LRNMRPRRGEKDLSHAKIFSHHTLIEEVEEKYQC